MVQKAIVKTIISTLTGAVLLGLSSIGGNGGNVLAVESASMSSSGVAFEITPTSANPNGTVAVGEDKLTISSTCSSGYTLYMSSAEDETALKDADNVENTIPSISGTIASPVLLNSSDNKNHWGFALTSTGIGSLTGTGFNESSITSSSKFAGIPSSDSLSAIRESNTGTSGGTSDNDEVSVYYAANAGTNLAPGNYSGSVLYTLVTPASCGYTLSFQADEESKDSAGNMLIGTVQSAGLTNEFKDPGSTINLNDYRAQYRDSSGVVKDLVEGNTLSSGSTLTRGFYLEGYTQTGWTVKELDSLTNEVLATNTYSINASSVAKTNSNADLVIVMPIWTINQYTISANTSTGINTTEVNINSTTANVNNSEIKFGDTVTIKYTLTPGYAFKEWQITSVGTNQSGNPFLTKDDMTISSGTDAAGTSVYTFTMPASNVSLTAKAEGIKYNISFNNNTGSGTMSTIEVTYGDSATLPTNAFTAPEHYEFFGWSTSAQTPTYEYADGVRKYTNGQTGVFNLTTTAGATVPLYALWIGKSNTVTIDKGDNVTNTTLGTNTTTNTSNSASYRYGQTVNINATVTTTGYHWNSWTVNSPSGLTLNSANTTASNSFTMPDSAVAITASATANNFTISVSGGYVGASGTSTSTTCSYGSSITIRANPSTGYHFTSWSSNNGGTFSSSTTASTTYNCTSSAAAGSNITLTAGSAINSFTISTSGGYVGTSGTSTSTSCNYGSSISIRAAAASTGYHFTSWSSNNGGSFANSATADTTYTCSSIAPNGSTITLTRNQAANTYTIIYNANSGTGTAPSNQSVTYGSSVTLRANTFTRTNYDFQGWNIGTSGTTETASYEENKSYPVSTLASAAGATGTNGANINLYAVWKLALVYDAIMQNWDGCTGLTISTTANYNNTDTYADLLDTRNNVVYRVRRYSDQNCWMTENLRLTPGFSVPTEDVTSGTLITTTAGSQVAGTVSFVPTFSTSSTDYVAEARYDASNTSPSANTGYYSWEAAKLVCPAGWTLPIQTEWTVFLSSENIAKSSTGSTKFRGAPYNFAYTGYYSGSSLNSGTSRGNYWSSTDDSDNTHYARDLGFSSSFVSSADNGLKRYGFAVRCIQNRTASTSMQDFKDWECAALVTSTTENYNNTDTYTTRLDTRNRVTYTVRKYADNKCWMVENLRITPGLYTPTADVTSGTLTTTTADSQAAGTVSFVSAFSTSYADFVAQARYDTSNSSSSINTGYYSWTAANMVCPASWTLPTKDEWNNFLSKESITNNSAGFSKIERAPYNFAYNGQYNGSLSLDTRGFFWSSTAEGGNGIIASYIRFYDDYYVNVANSGHKFLGMAVRCIHPLE